MMIYFEDTSQVLDFFSGPSGIWNRVRSFGPLYKSFFRGGIYRLDWLLCHSHKNLESPYRSMLGVSQYLILNELRESLQRDALYLNAGSVINAGATSLAEAGLDKYANLMAEVYSQGLKVTSDMCLGMATAAVVTACFMEFRSVK